MRRYASTSKFRPPSLMQEDEEGILYDDKNGFDIPSHQRRKKKSTFAPSKSKYIQHFPGGYKVESEVPAGTPVPFQAGFAPGYASPYPGYGSPYPGYASPGYASPGYASPYPYGGMNAYNPGYYGGYTPHHPTIAASKFSSIYQISTELCKFR